MNRLTGRNKNGNAYYQQCFSDSAPCGGGRPGEKCCRCRFSREQCETLAAYEDSGLTPAQVSALQDIDNRTKLAEQVKHSAKPFDNSDEQTLEKFDQFCKRLAESHKPEMPQEDRILLLCTSLSMNRLCEAIVNAKLRQEKIDELADMVKQLTAERNEAEYRAWRREYLDRNATIQTDEATLRAIFDAMDDCDKRCCLWIKGKENQHNEL